MKKRILSILLTMCMVLSLIPQTAFAEGNTSTAPSVSTYATKKQLMDGTFSPDPYEKVNIGKLVFGKKSDGTTPQEWYILGKDSGIDSDNTVIFAASPIATNQVIESNWGSDKTYNSSYGVYKTNPSKVLSNHYGASLLRAALQNMAVNTDYFTTAEQDLMNYTTVKTPDNYNGTDYTTRDKLYALSAERYGYAVQLIKAGSNDDKNLVRSAYWGDGGRFWLRMPDETYDDVAIAADPEESVVNAHIYSYYDVRPASNLNLSSVLFASSVIVESDNTATAGIIEPDKAMTLRLDGSSKNIGTVAYSTAMNFIEATKGSIAANVSLVVQGNDGTNNWYYSKPIRKTEIVNVSDIKSVIGTSSDIDLSACKIWLEATEDNMIYAVDALKGSATEAELREDIDSGAVNIKLINDITLTSPLLLTDKIIRLDLNGYVLTGDLTQGSYIILSVTDSATFGIASLILNDSNPSATHTNKTLPSGGVLNCALALNNENSSYNSTLYADGGTVTGIVSLNSTNSYIRHTTGNTTPTAFMKHVSGSNGGGIYSGIYYGYLAENLIKGHTVTFKDGNDIYAKEIVYYHIVYGSRKEGVAFAPIVPEKDGYAFAGWYNGDTKYDFTKEVTSDITLTAKWVNEVNSEATLRTAVDAGVNPIKLMSDINLSSALDLSQKNITVDLNGYVISGSDISINTGNGAANLTLIDSNPTATHTDKTLPLGGVVTSKISMKQSGGSYNTSFLYANGGTVTSEFNTNTNAVGIKCTSSTPTAFTGKISGYTHLFSGIYYGTIDSTVTIEGKKITFQNIDNTYAYEILSSGNNTIEPISPPIKAGYQGFGGWYSGNSKYTFGFALSENITLTAKFKNPITYNISYNLNGGTATNPTSYTVESENIKLNNPTKTGYSFTGWSGTGLSGNSNKNVTISQGSTGDRTYTANFSQNSYTVVFNTVGGSYISNKTNVKWTDKVLYGITPPTKDGFEFTGWKCGNMSVNENTKYSNLVTDDTISSVTLTAQWTERTDYSVIFDTAGGNNIEDKTNLKWDDTVLDGIDSPIKTGWEFTGWKCGDMSVNENTKYSDLVRDDTITSVTLTAQWTEKSNFSVIFDTNGGNNIENKTNVKWTDTVIYGIIPPTKDGFEFIGWKCADLSVNENTKYSDLVTDDTITSVTLTAQWKDISAPTGKISIDKNKWTEFLNNITFGLFFKDTKTVVITASDNSKENVTIEYLLSDRELEADELTNATFAAYTEAFTIDPDNQYVIYARLIDTSGNITYINSNGIVFDATAPVISGIENGKTYSSAQTVTVTEKYVASVIVNGEEVVLDDNNQFTLSPVEGIKSIVVTDKSGNSTTVIIIFSSSATTDTESDTSTDTTIDTASDTSTDTTTDTMTDTSTDTSSEYIIILPDETDTEPQKGNTGDIDGNGEITMLDVVMLQKAIAKLVEFTPTQTALADVNGDGKFTMVDVVLIQRYIAKLITSFD